MKKTNTFALIAILAMVPFAAFATGQAAADDDGPVEIEFFQQKQEAVDTYGELIALFEAENEGVTIQQNTVPEPGTVLISRMSSGDTPEIFSDYPTQLQFRQKTSNDYVLPLTEREFLDNVNPAMLEMTRQPDGELYTLPISQNFGGVYYHKDLFAELGIEIPATYDELIEVAQTLSDAGIQPFIFPDKNMVEHQWLIATGSIYPGFLNDLESVYEGENELSDFPRFRRAAEVFYELREYGSGDSLGVAYPQSAEIFANQGAAMTLLGSYALTSMMNANPDAQIAIFPFPGEVREDTSALAGVDAAVALSADGDHTDIGLSFLEFLSRTENAQLFSDLDLTPSCIRGVEVKNENISLVAEVIDRGNVTEWIKGVFEMPIVTAHDNVVQSLLVDGDVDRFLVEYERVFTEPQ